MKKSGIYTVVGGKRPTAQELVRKGRIMGFAGSKGNKGGDATNGSFEGNVLATE